MYRRFLPLLLIAGLLLSTVACGGGKKSPKMKEMLIAEGIINEEQVILEKDGVSLKVDPVMGISEAKASIFEVSNAPYLSEDQEELKVYDFRIEGISQVDGALRLTIPLSLEEGELPGAGYLNEETLLWESVSFYYDKETEAVTIYTEHLSKYGVFAASKEGSRHAKLEYLGSYGEGSDMTSAEAVREFAILGVPGKECYQIGLEALGDSISLGGDYIGGFVDALGQAAYDESLLPTIGDAIGNIGFALSVVDICNKVVSGKIHEAVVASMKTSFNYMLGKAVGALGRSVSQGTMIVVAIVDYSLDKFGSEAIAGREDIYRDAYNLYYQKGEDGYKGSDDWYKTFYPLISASNKPLDQVKDEIDQIVKEHCNVFWTSANQMGVDYFVSQAREQFKWTGGQAGLTQAMRDTISAERRATLYQQILPGVFHQIAYRMNLENEKRLRQEYKALSDFLNQTITLSVTDPSQRYANHVVRLGPLNQQAIKENWTGAFRKDGSLNTAFTLYGHLTSGSPNIINIYEPKADPDTATPVDTVQFKVKPPHIAIELKEETDRLTRLVLEDFGDPADMLFQDLEFKGEYAESPFPIPLRVLLRDQPITIPEDGIIDVSLSGSWTAPTRGDSYASVGASTNVVWSTDYTCNVSRFDLHLDIDTNEILPVKGSGDSVLRLKGTGTYSYEVTVTKTYRGKQTIPQLMAFMDEATIDGVAVTTVHFTASGDVTLRSSMRKVDDEKKIVITEDYIENAVFNDLVMIFDNSVAQGTSVTDNSTTTTRKGESGPEVKNYSTQNTIYAQELVDGEKIFKLKWPLTK